VPEPVEDPADPRLADYVDLRAGRPGGTGPVIVEGLLAVVELVRSELTIRSVLVSPRKQPRLPQLPAATRVYVAPDDVVRATVGFDLHRGVVASADRPTAVDPDAVLATARRVLVCERISDLENLGSLFRNARAFGADAVLLDPETADPLARRPVRVSLGHALRIPTARLTNWPDDLRSRVAAAGLEVVALTPAGDADLRHMPAPAAFLVGAEGPGLSPGALAAASRRIRIPMATGVDSLNVATAAAIALSAHFGQTGCR